MKKLRFGLIGYKFMGKAHTKAYTELPMYMDPPEGIEKAVLCGREEAWVKKVALQLGWQETETDWRRLVAREDIDAIDITSPSDTHKEIAIAAAEHGKHVFCEKPLALNLQDARDILTAVQKAGVRHQIGFNYRFAPALVLAKKLIDEGRIGRIFHVRGVFLQDWGIDPMSPFVWRFNKSICGSGSLGDLGAHVIDAARWLAGAADHKVSIKMAKAQKISLSPENLNGYCCRLKCCLAFETAPAPDGAPSNEQEKP